VATSPKCSRKFFQDKTKLDETGFLVRTAYRVTEYRVVTLTILHHLTQCKVAMSYVATYNAIEKRVPTCNTK